MPKSRLLSFAVAIGAIALFTRGPAQAAGTPLAPPGVTPELQQPLVATDSTIADLDSDDTATLEALLRQPMRFILVRTGYGGGTQVAVGLGGIKADTLQTFAAFVEANRATLTRGTPLYLFSGGGDLDVGIALGTAIRKLGLATVVGRPVESTSLLGPGPAPKFGFCASACTFAFLGGLARSVVPGSHFLVHRFTFEHGNIVQGSLNGISKNAQVTAGGLVAYINAMGIKPEFYTLMTQGGNSSEHPPKPLDETTLASLNVTTHETIAAHTTYTPGKPPVLEIRDENGGILNGRMEFLCAPGHALMLRAYFAPVRAQPSSVVVDLNIYGADGHIAKATIPPQDFTVHPPVSDTLAIDVYIPPGQWFAALENAVGVSVGANGPGVSFFGTIPRYDSIGDTSIRGSIIGTLFDLNNGAPIPADVHSRIMAVAKSCN